MPRYTHPVYKPHMIYREYGSTGLSVSALGFGAMRFENADDIDGSAETVLHAFRRGINYFDTAPGYFQGKSEQIFGRAVPEMKRSGSPFYLSTKSNKADGSEVRRELEVSLERFGVDAVDFFHCWYVLTPEDWERRKKGGAVDAILRAKEEGLIRHAVFSTHLPGDEIRRVIEEGWFEGVTLGYSAINFPQRAEGIAAAGENGLGVVVMNPLGGGAIPQNEEAFGFIRVRPGQTMVDAALHFLWSDPRISVALVGCRNRSDVDDAVRAAESFEPYTEAEIASIRKRIEGGFNELCTSCMYCRDCPVDIEVWKFVETANYLRLIGDGKLSSRLKYHWGADIGDLDRCIECRKCEDACTQRLPILQRFAELQEAIHAESR